MANINQVITLGIGTPSDITHFVLVGLGPLQVSIIDSWTLQSRDLDWSIDGDRDFDWSILDRSTAWTVEDK